MNHTKICSQCKQEKNLKRFNKNKNHKDGLQNICIICVKLYNKQYYIINKEKIDLHQKQYDLENKEKVQIYRKIHEKQRRKNDALFKIKKNLRTRINIALKSQNVKKILHIKDGLCCTNTEFQNHIKSLLCYRMLIENNSPRKWILHHLLSFDSVDLKDLEQLKKVCHYTNIVPMWADEHKEFHRKYGTKTTKEQYNEFIQKKT